jgi:hypothetical protein
MAKQLTKTGINIGQTVFPQHILQIIEAFTNEEDYDIILSGSFQVNGPLFINNTSSLSDVTIQGNTICEGNINQSGSYEQLGNNTISGSLNISGSININDNYKDYAFINIPKNDIINNKYSAKFEGGDTLNLSGGPEFENNISSNIQNQGIISFNENQNIFENINSYKLTSLQGTIYSKLDDISLEGNNTGSNIDLLSYVDNTKVYGNKFFPHSLFTSTDMKVKNIKIEIEGYVDFDGSGNTLEFIIKIGNNLLPLNIITFSNPFSPIETQIPYKIDIDLIIHDANIKYNGNIQIPDVNNNYILSKYPLASWNTSSRSIIPPYEGDLQFQFEGSSNIGNITGSYACVKFIN